MPVKELQLESGGSADFLIRETGDVEDTILLEDSTAPTTKVVGMKATASGSKSRVKILSSASKASSINKESASRAKVLAKSFACVDVHNGTKANAIVKSVSTKTRSSNLGSKFSHIRKSPTSKASALGETTASPATRKTSQAVCKSVAMAKKLPTSCLFMRAAARLVSKIGATASRRPSAAATCQGRTSNFNISIKIHTSKGSALSIASGSSRSASVFGKFVAMASTCRQASTRSGIYSASAKTFGQWKLAGNPSSRILVGAHCKSSSLASSPANLVRSQIGSTKSRPSTSATRCSFASSEAKGRSLGSPATIGARSACGTAKGSSRLLGQGRSTSIKTAIPKTGSYSTCRSQIQTFLSRSAATRAVSFAKSTALISMGSDASGRSSSSFQIGSSARSSAASKSCSWSAISSPTASIYAAKASWVGNSPAFAPATSVAIVGVFGRGVSGTASRPTVVVDKTAKASSHWRGCSEPQRFRASKACATSSSAMAAGTSAKVSAVAKSMALANFTAACSIRLSIHFSASSTSIVRGDIGKPPPETYVYLLGSIEDPSILGSSESAPSIVGAVGDVAVTASTVSDVFVVGAVVEHSVVGLESQPVDARLEVEDDVEVACGTAIFSELISSPAFGAGVSLSRIEV